MTREEHDRRFPWHHLEDYQGGDGQTYQWCQAPGCGFDTAKETTNG